jgi:hypothetical protein
VSAASTGAETASLGTLEPNELATVWTALVRFIDAMQQVRFVMKQGHGTGEAFAGRRTSPFMAPRMKRH